MSVRNGASSSPFHLGRVRKRSEKRAAGSTGRSDAGKYLKAVSVASMGM